MNIKLISVLIACIFKREERAIIIPSSDKSKPERKKKLPLELDLKFAIELLLLSSPSLDPFIKQDLYFFSISA